jgi:hypothetical protein
MKPALRRTIHGALGGAIGAACMTAIRMLARRAGLIQQMVPQAVEAWAHHDTRLALPPLPSQRALHHAADQAMHVAYGATFGAAYGITLGRRRATPAVVAGFGAGVWLLGSFVLLPALKIMRPEWRAKPREIAVNVAAHLLYAAALGLVTDEFESQSVLQPLQYPLSVAAKTG